MSQPDVLRYQHLSDQSLSELLGRYGLKIVPVADTHPIPGSFWGDDEAGLIGNELYLRPDTPLHSALHEACHFICMDPQRRNKLHTNAGGDHAEENAVCYLQLLLADAVTGFGFQRALQDMDSWGYSFRLGSAKAWFEQDAQDARDWLVHEGLLDTADHVTGRLRGDGFISSEQQRTG